MCNQENIHCVLGQQIYRGGLTPTKAKLKAVRDWPTLKDIKGVYFLLEFSNYYRWFIKNFAAIVKHLTSLT